MPPPSGGVFWGVNSAGPSDVAPFLPRALGGAVGPAPRHDLATALEATVCTCGGWIYSFFSILVLGY